MAVVGSVVGIVILGLIVLCVVRWLKKVPANNRRIPASNNASSHSLLDGRDRLASNPNMPEMIPLTFIEIGSKENKVTLPDAVNKVGPSPSKDFNDLMPDEDQRPLESQGRQADNRATDHQDFQFRSVNVRPKKYAVPRQFDDLK